MPSKLSKQHRVNRRSRLQKVSYWLNSPSGTPVALFLLLAVIYVVIALVGWRGGPHRDTAETTRESAQPKSRSVENHLCTQRDVLILQSLRALIELHLGADEVPELGALRIAILAEQCRLEKKAVDYVKLECTAAPAVKKQARNWKYGQD